MLTSRIIRIWINDRRGGRPTGRNRRSVGLRFDESQSSLMMLSHAVFEASPAASSLSAAALITSAP